MKAIYKVLFITKKIKLIDKKIVPSAALDSNYETYVIYVEIIFTKLSPHVTCQCFSYLLIEFHTNQMKRRVHNPAFLHTAPKREQVPQQPASSRSVLLRTRTVITNTIGFGAQNVQQQCERHQRFTRE